MSDRPTNEHIVLRGSDAGLIEQHSLEERIRRAEHDAGMPIGKPGRQSHCWLCRRDFEAKGGYR